MKNISVITAGLAFFLYSLAGMCNTTDGSPTGAQNKASSTHQISLVSSPELSDLANSWAEEYGKLNPGVHILVSNGNSQPAGPDQICLATNDFSATGNDQVWKMTVGRDATIVVFNANNPLLKEISAQGIAPDELAALIADPAKRNWKNIIDKGADAPIHCFSIDSEKVKENLAAFALTETVSIGCTDFTMSSEIISAVKKDIYAIGFCRLNDVRDAQTNELTQGIRLLPIDKNGNGRLDSFENIYSNIASFTRGIWIGKYPRALCGNIYAVSASKPTDESTVAFLSWIITEGQKYLNSNGYSDLTSAEIKTNKSALMDEVKQGGTTPLATAENKPAFSTVWMIILLFTALLALVFGAILRYGKKQNWITNTGNMDASPVLNEDSIAAPKGLYFDKTHTWAFMEKDGNVKVGIDDFLQHVTGTLTRVIMKDTGDKVRKGDKILTIVRDGKQLSIYAPISGTIIQQNSSLISNSSLVNSSPYAEGWVYLIEPNNWAREMRFLFMGEKYTAWIEDEFIRLKDFFASSARSKTPAMAQVILQDGGELSDHILADLEPEVWEDFQIKFINTSR